MVLREFGDMRNVEDCERWYDPWALPLMMTLSLYGGAPIIDRGMPGYHYAEIGENRVGLHRLIVNSPKHSLAYLATRHPDPLFKNHRDLRYRTLLEANAPGLPRSMSLEQETQRKKRAFADRLAAIEEALRLYRKAYAAGEWVGPSLIAYRAMLEAAFVFFDQSVGAKVMPAAAE